MFALWESIAITSVILARPLETYTDGKKFSKFRTVGWLYWGLTPLSQLRSYHGGLVFPGFLTPVLTQLFFQRPPTTFLICFCRAKRMFSGCTGISPLCSSVCPSVRVSVCVQSTIFCQSAGEDIKSNSVTALVCAFSKHCLPCHGKYSHLR